MKRGSRYRERRRISQRVKAGTSWDFATPQGAPLPGTYKEWWREPQDTLSAASHYVKRCWDELHRRTYWQGAYADLLNKVRPLYREGGPLYIIEANNPWYTVQGFDQYMAMPSTAYGYAYEGGFLPSSFGPYQVSSLDMDAAGLLGPYKEPGDASPYGPEGWNKARPRPDTANAAQALYELKDLIPMLKKTAEGLKDIWNGLGGHPVYFSPKKVADHFLNHEFGWKPFLKDVKDLYGTYSDLDRRIAQIKRDNGKWTRRRRTVRRQIDQSTVVVETSPRVWPTMNSYLYKWKGSQYGRSSFYQETVDEIWFEGCFSYYLPAFDTDKQQKNDYWGYKFAQNATALGLRYSPALVYKVMPWTWLGDWFHNGKDVIDNINASAEDNLAAKYAYIMRKTSKRVVNDSQLWTVQGDVNLFWYQEIATKHREAASPYGFNLNWENLSPKQLAILAALGVSKFH